LLIVSDVLPGLIVPSTVTFHSVRLTVGLLAVEADGVTVEAEGVAADVLGVAVGTVKSRMFRARKALCAAIADEEAGT